MSAGPGESGIHRPTAAGSDPWVLLVDSIRDLAATHAKTLDGAHAGLGKALTALEAAKAGSDEKVKALAAALTALVEALAVIKAESSRSHKIDRNEERHDLLATRVTKLEVDLIAEMKSISASVTANSKSLEGMTAKVMGIAAGISFVVGAVGFLIALMRFGGGG